MMHINKSNKRELRKIEKKLGIGLATIFNADEIWFRLNGRIYRATQTFAPLTPMFFFSMEEIIIFGCKRNDVITVYPWTGYGKTWAFTREELNDQH